MCNFLWLVWLERLKVELVVQSRGVSVPALPFLVRMLQRSIHVARVDKKPRASIPGRRRQSGFALEVRRCVR